MDFFLILLSCKNGLRCLDSRSFIRYKRVDNQDHFFPLLVHSNCFFCSVAKQEFSANAQDFPPKYGKFPQSIKDAGSADFSLIQISCSRWRYKARPYASSSKVHSLLCDHLVTDKDIAKNTVPIQEAPFQSAAMHQPISLGRQHSRLQRLDVIIQFVLDWF